MDHARWKYLYIGTLYAINKAIGFDKFIKWI